MILAKIKQNIMHLTPNNPASSGWSSYSQYDEDGIIRECLQRINRICDLTGTFIEIGCGSGHENNTHQLLLDGFAGVWVDGNSANTEKAYQELKGFSFPQLLIINQMVNLSTAKKLIERSKSFLGTEYLDFMSVDIDGIDQYITKNFLESFKPKLLCVEYNAKFPPPTDLVIQYNPSHLWQKDDYFGASLQSWANFLEKFDYCLVACNLTGCNAFFVQKNLMETFTHYKISELYQPARYELILQKSGHAASLKWLKQILHRPYNSQSFFKIKSQTNKKQKIVKVKYGEMIIYEDDKVIGESLKTNGSFQEAKIFDVLLFLKNNFHYKPKKFIDIGANIGTHSTYAIKSGLFMSAEAYEPDADNFYLLNRNLAINNICESVSAYPLALSNQVGSLEMEYSDYNFGDHRISPTILSNVSFGEEVERRKGFIQASTIDKLFIENKIDWSEGLVWLDTQGHEGHIFSGSSEFMKSECAPKFVVAEFWPYGLERSGGKEKYFEFLKSCKLIYNINQKNLHGFKKVTINELLDNYDEMLKATKKEFHPHTDLLLCI